MKVAIIKGTSKVVVKDDGSLQFEGWKVELEDGEEMDGKLWMTLALNLLVMQANGVPMDEINFRVRKNEMMPARLQ